MTDRSNEPLTEAEKKIFGEYARRLPSGEVQETGIGSKVNPDGNPDLGGFGGGMSRAEPVFNARADQPLSEMDKRVFGVDAVRRVDGSIREAGSSHDRDVLRHRAILDQIAARRAAPAEPEPRALDLRAIHPSPERMQ
jgi:hypothetical protein